MLYAQPYPLAHTLDKAVGEMLEAMFFADPRPSEPLDFPSGSICTFVRFSGTADGTLQLQLPRCKASEMAADFLGVAASQVNDEQIIAVCGEMTNMICGAMVSLAVPEGRFSLDSPVIGSCDDTEPRRKLSRYYDVDGEPLEVVLTYDGTLGQAA